MERDEKETTITSTIQNEFEALPFTRVTSNTHYASSGAEDLARRTRSVEEFLSDTRLDEPELYPTRYGQDVITETARKYEAMLDVLVAQPERSPEDEALIDKLIDKTAELFRYEELALAMGEKAIEDVEDHRRLARELSLEILGGVDKAAFATLLGELTDMAKQSGTPYGKELLDRVGELPLDGEMKSIELEDSTREIIGSDLVTLYPGLGELLREPDSGPLSPEAALPIFNRLLQIADLDDEWSAELTNSKVAETNSSKKMVTIGIRRAAFKTFRDALAVGVHEVIVHAGRSEGMSMPGVTDFEEGLATRLQQIISGERRTPGVQYYLSIGLQAGIDQDGAPRNYRDTFEILWRREALLMEKAGKEVDIQLARSRAQAQVTRTRRGGAIDTRDASYFIGGQKAAQWLNALANLPVAERRKKLALVLAHKYDPTIPEQEAYIERYSHR